MIKNLNFEQFIDEVVNGSRPSVVKFLSKGCHLCVEFAPIFENLHEKYNNAFNFYKIDIEQEKELSEHYAKGGVPTVYVFTSMGEYEIPDPKKPDEKTWFTEKYISNTLEMLKGL